MSKKKTTSKIRAKKKTKQKRSDSPQITPQPSMQSMENILSGISGYSSGSSSAVYEAQKVMYEAWEATTLERRVSLAKKALTISEDCADAYNLLANDTAKTIEEALEMYQMAVEAGQRAIGEVAFEEDTGFFWGVIETRPYMRARANLAEVLREVGRLEEAVQHYWDMLRLNTRDNQALRYYLMPSLIELNRDKDAEKLYKQFEEDSMTFWIYSRALLDFRKQSGSQKAVRSLKKAFEGNQHVPEYLLNRKKMPRILPNYYSSGSDDEAVLYVLENWKAWNITPNALEWLSINVK